jgi:hypothetical protein
VHHGAPPPLHAQLRLIAELDWFTDNENTGVAVAISGLPQEYPTRLPKRGRAINILRKHPILCEGSGLEPAPLLSFR